MFQFHLKMEDSQLVMAFNEEIIQVHKMFDAHLKRPPQHKNMPHIISKLFWVRAIKERIQVVKNFLFLELFKGYR